MTPPAAADATRRPPVVPLRAAQAPLSLAPVSEASARLLAVVGVVAIAVIHILDAPGTYGETRYIFWLYMAIIVGAIPISLLLMHWGSPVAWVGPAVLAAAPLIGYILTRTVGLPGDTSDIGNWLEPLGMASLFVEACVLSLSLTQLALHRRQPTAG